MPQTTDILARVPPHIHREFRRLIDDLPRSLRCPNAGDMVAALLLAARRSPETVRADLETYYEIKDDWMKNGEEWLPELEATPPRSSN